MGRNYLAHASGDAINAVLAAAGYNFSLSLNCFTRFGNRPNESDH
jgi:IS5 family transposase